MNVDEGKVTRPQEPATYRAMVPFRIALTSVTNLNGGVETSAFVDWAVSLNAAQILNRAEWPGNKLPRTRQAALRQAKRAIFEWIYQLERVE
jgi:hypothetical protein